MMMASDRFSDLKNIDIERKMTVSGYIHELESKYDEQIPQAIIVVCILFYGDDTDSWDPKYISKYMELSDRTLTQVKDGMGSSFGERIIDSGIFKWRLKINECKTYGFMLGIVRIQNDNIPPKTDKWFTKVSRYQSGYAFHSNLRTLTVPNGSALGPKYGIDPPNGSIIEMRLDLENLKLSYIIDGKDYGKAFDVEQGKYKLGLYMRKPRDSLTLL